MVFHIEKNEHNDIKISVEMELIWNVINDNYYENDNDDKKPEVCQDTLLGIEHSDPKTKMVPISLL